MFNWETNLQKNVLLVWGILPGSSPTTHVEKDGEEYRGDNHQRMRSYKQGKKNVLLNLNQINKSKEYVWNKKPKVLHWKVNF